MGNEQSQLPDIEIEEKAVEVSDFWSQHSASIFGSENTTSLSVFIGELFVSGSLWSSQTPLEKSSKNLMIYRHPCIIKYVSSWQKSSKFYLAVEEVTPLSHVLPTLNTLQICIGLYSILKALHFLHDKASVSHNNICTTSIYVTKDGSWKLGGMEYLCKYRDLSCDYLNKSKSNRFSKAIDPNEDKLLQNNLGRKDFIDIYAFGVLAYDLLRSKNDDEISTLRSFREYCKNELQSNNLSQRPKMTSILQHEFFNHEFITIHSFLMELPLKSDEEKTQFFKSLAERLRSFDEVIIASQLNSLLLSRMVLLNKTAQNDFLPLLLTPRQGKIQPSESALFSEEIFITYISPRLLEIITVRDAQIRLLLLNHFTNFMHTFTNEELQSHVLPELLVGIKDTNDHLVSVTLRTLAELVPVLGSTTVIGGKRAKLFNDGRPTHPVRRLSRSIKTRESLQPLLPIVEIVHENGQTSSNSSVVESNNLIELPERPRPDGEEGETSTEEIEQSVDEDLDNWEDWDINENSHNSNTQATVSNTIETIAELIVENLNLNENKLENTSSQLNTARSKIIIPDILELDIKNQLNNEQKDEFNFFQDMEPVIDTCNKFIINENGSSALAIEKVSDKLALNVDCNNEDGWGDGDWE